MLFLWPKVLYEFLNLAPILLVLRGVEFLTTKNLWKPTRRTKRKCFKPNWYSITLYVCFPRRLEISSAEFTPFWWFLSFPSCISPPPKLPTPSLIPSASIYRLPLVGLSWWGGGFLCLWVPLVYIPDQMGPTSHDWCNSLETCTHCQTMLDRRFIDPGLVLDLDQALVPQIDIGPDLTWHVSLL